MGFRRSALFSLVDYVNQKLKAEGVDHAKVQALPAPQNRHVSGVRKLARDNAELFVHWQLFVTTTFTFSLR